MKLMSIQKQLRHYWRTYGTLNNAVMLVAVVIAVGWAWGSVSMIQTNFSAQKAVIEQQRQLELTQLEVDTLKYQQNFYKSDEYKDLAAREDLGLASPGEDVLILPPNSAAVKQADAADGGLSLSQKLPTPLVESNFNQWLTFLSGGNVESSLQK